MKINILTLFPNMFDSVFAESIIQRGQKNGAINIQTHNLRDWAVDKHKKVDDKPYGGGSGMLLKVDVIDRALYDIKLNINVSNVKAKNIKPYTVLLTPQGKTFNQKIAKKLSAKNNLILVCGHYEGFDERVRGLVDEQISIGDFVLTGGEIPAMTVIDAVSRLVKGVLGKNDSHEIESFSMDDFINNSDSKSYLEFPQYTSPRNYKPISKNRIKTLEVPEVLLSGDHKKIYNWRVEQSIKKSTSK
jgi:tRNA (guanine37-N1)-methyltransferase